MRFFSPRRASVAPKLRMATALITVFTLLTQSAWANPRALLRILESGVGRTVTETPLGRAHARRVTLEIQRSLGLEENANAELSQLLRRLSSDQMDDIARLGELEIFNTRVRRIHRRMRSSGKIRERYQAVLSDAAETEVSDMVRRVFPDRAEFVQATSATTHAESRAAFLEAGRSTTMTTESTGALWDAQELSRLLRTRGTRARDVSPLLRGAMERGLVTEEALVKYVKFDDNPVMGLVMKHMPGMRDRILGDPGFFMDLLIEEALGVSTILLAEARQYGDGNVLDGFQNIWDDPALLGKVAVDVVSIAFIDFTLVFLLSPRMSRRLALFDNNAGRRGVGGYLDRLPDHVFEASPAGHRYTMGQRAQTFFVRGAQFTLAGAFAGVAGTALTNGIYALAGEEPPDSNPTYAESAHDFGRFMFESSNPRYQIVNGLTRLLNRGLGRSPLALVVAKMALRGGNTYFGGEHYLCLSKDWRENGRYSMYDDGGTYFGEDCLY